MCGRFTILASKTEIEEYFQAEFSEQFELPVYNAAPTMFLPVITAELSDKIQLFKWGKTSNTFQNQGILINAKAETIFEKKSFKDAAKVNRCLVIATGFFEWEKKGKEKLPYLFQSEDRKFICFAGIYFKGSSINRNNDEFVIVTTEPNKQVALIHSRMPLMLSKEEIGFWLKNEMDEYELQKFINSHTVSDLNMKQVSKIVNSAKVNSPLIFNIENDNSDVQGELF